MESSEVEVQPYKLHKLHSLHIAEEVRSLEASVFGLLLVNGGHLLGKSDFQDSKDRVQGITKLHRYI